jgi:hypothetical protein
MSKRRTIDVQTLSEAELGKLYEQAEKITPETPSRPLDAEDRALFRKAARRGRPRIGKGSERVNVTLERSLLARIDVCARSRGMSRAAFLAEGARRLLSA